MGEEARMIGPEEGKSKDEWGKEEEKERTAKGS
jgi:hypothetical protein